MIKQAASASLLYDLHRIRQSIIKEAEAQVEAWSPWLKRPTYRPSALNLAAYLAFRRRDFRPYQDALYPLGLSSMSHCESHVLQNLDAIVHALYALERMNPLSPFEDEGFEMHGHLPDRKAEFELGYRHLKKTSKHLLGEGRKNRNTRIVVTLPTEAADDKAWILDLVKHGMDCCRINCAHDNPDIWARMMEKIHDAEKKTGREVRVLMDLAGPKLRTGSVVPLRQREKISVGDGIWLHPESGWNPNGKWPTSFGGKEISPGFLVSCSISEPLQAAKRNDRVFFDDGLFSAHVVGRWGAACYLLVDRAPAEGKRLKADKGINMPDTEFKIQVPTVDDIEALPFVLKHAHMVGLSFVQSAEDVLALQEQMRATAKVHRQQGKSLPSIIAKIETAKAIAEMPHILVAACGSAPAGVMIARGDLAVEIGFLRMAEMQEELLWISEAAHVPVIWATQVLENMAKHGMPSRAEMTDAAMSVRADAVMLNKGPYMLETVQALDLILHRMEEHQRKKSPRLRALRAWA